MSIKVVANNVVREDAVEEFLALAKELVEKTNALDEGCISYSLCRSVQQPFVLTMIEEWESQEALDKHMKAPHFVELIPKISALTDPGSAAIGIYEKVF